jgi:hypothetical protein
MVRIEQLQEAPPASPPPAAPAGNAPPGETPSQKAARLRREKILAKADARMAFVNGETSSLAAESSSALPNTPAASEAQSPAAPDLPAPSTSDAPAHTP